MYGQVKDLTHYVDKQPHITIALLRQLRIAKSILICYNILVIEAPPSIEVANFSRLPESVNLHFYFAPHFTREDFVGLAELIKKCDVYLPEVAIWDDNLQALYSDTALGNKVAYQTLSRQFIGLPDEDAKAYELKLLYGSHKKILLTGFSASLQNAIDLRDAFQRMSHAKSNVEQYVAESQNMAEVQSRREETIIADLATRLPELIVSSPKLSVKPELKVLLNLGAMHTSAYKTVADTLNSPERKRVTRTFYKKPVLFPLHTAIVRKHIFMPPVTVEDSRVILDKMVQYRESWNQE